jgi:hypothetical protein
VKPQVLRTTRHLLIVLCLLPVVPPLPALDFFLRPGGFFFIPKGEGNVAADGNPRYGYGFGGSLGAEIDLASVLSNPLGLSYSVGIEGALHSQAMQDSLADPVQLYSGGAVLGLAWFPLSRLFTRLDFAGGIYQASQGGTKGNPGLFWRGGGELGFRITPIITVAANLGYKEYLSGSRLLNTGLYAGLTMQLTFEAGKNARGEGAGVVFTQDDGVYPVFLSLYQKSPVGTITIRNNENAEIRGVRVSFRAAGYTASEFPCGELPLIAKGRGAELPLYADFSPELLRFTDTGRILGEVIVRYRCLGTEKQTARTVAVRVHNRNVFPPADAAGLAAFVSPASQEVLEYAKHITGLARSNRRTGLNQNMQFAVWLFEGLRAAGVRQDGRHTGEGEAQYPAETLGFRTGDGRDIGLLYAAALEASGISAAIIPLGGDGDFVVACHLGVDQAGAGLLFDGFERVLVVDGQVWLPLSMNVFNDGFIAAWDGGVEALNGVFAAGDGVEFIMPEAAWGQYPPAPLPAQGNTAVRVNEGNLAQAAEQVIERYIIREIQPQVEDVERRIGDSSTAEGPLLASLHNRLGILLVRAGRTAEGKGAYGRAAAMGLVPAMTNLGNLALTEKDYAEAERWFLRALEREPENAAALRGMERVGQTGDTALNKQ